MRNHTPHGLLAFSVSIATVAAISVGLSQPGSDDPSDTGTLVDVAVTDSGDQVVISLVGDRILSGSLQEINVPPYRVFVDFPAVVPDVDPVTRVERGSVDQIRVALNQSHPPVTRVVLDLSHRSTYRVERGPEEFEFRIIVGPASRIDSAVSERRGESTEPSDGATHPAPTTAHYAGWFARVTQQIENLLLIQSSARFGEESDTSLDPDFDWPAIRREVELVTAPPSLQETHQLLLISVNLGSAGASLSGATTQDDRAAARAGANMLLVRARALVRPQSNPITHSEDGR